MNAKDKFWTQQDYSFEVSTNPSISMSIADTTRKLQLQIYVAAKRTVAAARSVFAATNVQIVVTTF